MKINHLLETALWSSLALNSENEEAHFDDLGFTIYDFHPDAHAQLSIDCSRFARLAMAEGIDILDFEDWQHDFWLTRNRHGAGFWDGDYDTEIGEKLTAISHQFKEVDLILVDGKIEIM